jgi:preprotein translocase subunit SecY
VDHPLFIEVYHRTQIHGVSILIVISIVLVIHEHLQALQMNAGCESVIHWLNIRKAHGPGLFRAGSKRVKM